MTHNHTQLPSINWTIHKISQVYHLISKKVAPENPANEPFISQWCGDFSNAAFSPKSNYYTCFWHRVVADPLQIVPLQFSWLLCQSSRETALTLYALTVHKVTHEQQWRVWRELCFSILKMWLSQSFDLKRGRKQLKAHLRIQKNNTSVQRQLVSSNQHTVQ